MSNFYHSQNVFVASDFLPYSTQALKLARTFAQPTHASITLFHAIEKLSGLMRDLLFPYAALGEDESEILMELKHAAHARGEAYLRAMDISNIKLSVDFARDSMAKSILHAANEANADILFAGAYGTKPHTTGIIGSMASTMAAYSRIPLYLVKDPVGKATHKKILVALNDPQVSLPLLQWAISFALRFKGCDVHIVTPVVNPKLYDEREDFTRLNVNAALIQSATDAVTKRAKVAIQSIELPFAFEEQAKDFTFKHHAPVAKPASAIIQTAEDIGADLIVLASAQPNLEPENALRDITRSVIEYAKQNVLILPAIVLGRSEA